MKKELKRCTGEMRFKELSHDGGGIYACNECGYSNDGTESTTWANHLKEIRPYNEVSRQLTSSYNSTPQTVSYVTWLENRLLQCEKECKERKQS